jgi:hypothetical protein
MLCLIARQHKDVHCIILCDEHYNSIACNTIFVFAAKRHYTEELLHRYIIGGIAQHFHTDQWLQSSAGSDAITPHAACIQRSQSGAPNMNAVIVGAQTITRVAFSSSLDENDANSMNLVEIGVDDSDTSDKLRFHPREASITLENLSLHRKAKALD